MMKKKMIIQKQELVDAYVLDLRGNLEGDQGKHTLKKKIQEQVDDYVLNLRGNWEGDQGKHIFKKKNRSKWMTTFWTYAGIWERC